MLILYNNNKTLSERLDLLIVNNDKIIEQNDQLLDEVRDLRK